MRISETKYKILVGILALVALCYFNQSVVPYKSSQQLGFDEWFTKVEPLLLNAETEPQALPKIELSFQPEASESTQALPRMNLAVDPNLGHAISSRSEQMLRLLQLVKEANFFSIGKGALPQITTALTSDLNSTDNLVLRIAQGDLHFETSVSKNALAENLAAQNMLKLLQIYSSEQPELKTALKSTAKGQAKVARH